MNRTLSLIPLKHGIPNFSALFCTTKLLSFDKIKIHSESDGLPNHELFDVCLVGVEENRNSFFESKKQNLKSIREELYKLKFGNWKIEVSDLGDLPNGETVDDSYHALYDICKELLSKKTI